MVSLDKRKLERFRGAAGELARYLKKGPHRSMAPERAFIEWYVEARFGGGEPKRILDQRKDGGLDAIVERDGVAFIIQSKYERTGRVSPIPRGEISDFENTVRKFRDPDYLDEYTKWRDRKVRPEIRSLYNRVRKSAIERPENVRFLFVTPKRSEDHDNGTFEIEDIQNVSALWYLFAEGFTPPTEHIELELNNWWPTSVESKYKTYVGLADVLDFLKLMSRDVNERLFAQNVRTNLGSKVNDRIRNTYEKQPEIFWLCNNGIYIVCSEVTSHGNLHRLTYPSVINGSQTLHAIAESNLRHSCRILVRISPCQKTPTPVSHKPRRFQLPQSRRVVPATAVVFRRRTAPLLPTLPSFLCHRDRRLDRDTDPQGRNLSA